MMLNHHENELTEDSLPGFSEKVQAKAERRKVLFSAIFAGFPVVIICLVFFFQWFYQLDLHQFALEPRKLSGLTGIVFEPLIHGNFSHLISNIIPLFILLMGAVYFYRGLGFKVTFWIWVLTGSLVWCFGRPSFHIGASGVVYGLASFHAFSGFIRKNPRLISISLLTIFAYGGLIWGIFPFIPGISWESHLMGGLSGLFCALYYRNEGPQAPVHFQDDEQDEESRLEENLSGEDLNEGNPKNTHPTVRYIYVSDDDKNASDEENAKS